VFSRGPAITAAIADGRGAGLTIDAAVRGIRQALATLRQTSPELSPGLRLTVLTADGTSVTWRADTEVINVSV
jgi:hypothetical protein